MESAHSWTSAAGIEYKSLCVLAFLFVASVRPCPRCAILGWPLGPRNWQGVLLVHICRGVQGRFVQMQVGFLYACVPSSSEYTQ